MSNNNPFWNTVGDFANLIGLNPLPGSQTSGGMSLFKRATRNFPNGGGSYQAPTSVPNQSPQSAPGLTQNNVPKGGGGSLLGPKVAEAAGPEEDYDPNFEPNEADIAYAVNKIGGLYQNQSASSLLERRQQLMDEKARTYAYQESNPYYNEDEEVPYTYAQLDNLNNEKLGALNKELDFVNKAIKGEGDGTGSGADLSKIKLSAGQKVAVSDWNTVQKGIKDLVDLGNTYGGYVGAGPGSFVNSGLASLTGKIRPGAQDIRNSIGQIRGFIAKARGGTSFTENEEKLLNSYTPKAGDSDAVLDSKLRSLQKFVANQINSIYAVASGDPNIDTSSIASGDIEGGEVLEGPGGSGPSNIIIAPDGTEIELID